MPMRVMFRMLGMPLHMTDEVVSLTDLILAAGDPDYAGHTGEDRNAALVKKYRRLHETMAELADERRRRPGDDLIAKLITSNVDGEFLTQNELGKFFTLLLVADSETARSTLANTLDLLTEHPEQRSPLLADLPDRLPTTIEEVIRFATPTRWMRGNVTAEGELSGHV